MIITIFWLMIAVGFFAIALYVISFSDNVRSKFEKATIWMLIALCLLWPAAIVFIVADAGVEKLTDWVKK